jgi:hypothetical protein
LGSLRGAFVGEFDGEHPAAAAHLALGNGVARGRAGTDATRAARPWSQAAMRVALALWR